MRKAVLLVLALALSSSIFAAPHAVMSSSIASTLSSHKAQYASGDLAITYGGQDISRRMAVMNVDTNRSIKIYHNLVG